MAAGGDPKTHEFVVPTRVIKSPEDMEGWPKSQVRYVLRAAAPYPVGALGGWLQVRIHTYTSVLAWFLSRLTDCRALIYTTVRPARLYY